LTLNVGGTYARATLIGAEDLDMSGTIGPDEIVRTETQTAALWNASFRYDRFLSANNLLYATVLAGGNVPGGKEVFAGGQAGYARQLYKSDVHLIVAEVGFDYTYE